MNVWGELIKAQAENLASDPSAGIAGRIFYNTADKELRFDDGTDIREVLTTEYGASKGYDVLDSSILLDANYLPATTGVYAHHLNGLTSDVTNWTGGQDMTVGAGALTTQTSPLGQASTYCAFDGSTYLSNSTITVGNNPSFTWAGWVYFADWNNSTSETIFSEKLTADGFILEKKSSNKISFYNYTSTAYELEVDCSDLPAGWAHIIYSRSHGNFSMMLINGAVRGYNKTAGAITAAGSYELGSREGGTLMTGGLWDVMLDVNTAFTADQGRKLYAASSGKFCIESDSGDVYINGKQPTNIIDIQSAITVNIATANTAVEQQYIPEDGYYRILQNITYNNEQANTTALRYLVSSIYANAVSLAQSWGQLLVVAGGSSYTSTSVLWEGYLEKDDIIYSYGAASANTVINAKYSQVSIERAK